MSSEANVQATSECEECATQPCAACPDTLVQRLRAGCTDWDGSELAAETQPMECLTVGDVRAAATEIEVLRNDLNTALSMLAGWCVAVDVNGTGWDDWDEHYKDAMYRDGPLRAMLDKAIAEARIYLA